MKNNFINNWTKQPEMPDIEYIPEMPFNPEISEDMRSIMPDYKKWRDIFFQLDCFFVGSCFFIELIMFFFLHYQHLIKETLGRYCFFYLFLPTVLNVLIIVFATLFRKILPDHDMRQNFVPIFALSLISFVVSLTHSAFYTTLGIYAIPIFMTTIFNSKKMCQVTTYLSIGGVIFATAKHFMTTENPTTRIWVFPECLIMVCILVLLGLVAQTLLAMNEGQKLKLIDYARTAKIAHHREKAANKAKSTFLANMSHEIRTPINAILGMNEMILRESENEQITEYASNIHSAGNSLLYLINDVLDISKIESGKLDIIEATYDTSSFIHNCYTMISERAEKKGLELHVVCDSNLPSQLKGDEVRLRQIVTNFLSNAAKYTEKGSITLTVNSRQEEDAFFLIISVEDTGIGIKEENIHLLFSQFTRFDLEKNHSIEGTGLGLAITKQLTELMHGDLDVQSTYGVGSTFTVTIPQQVIDAAPMGEFHKRYREINKNNEKYHQSFEAPDAKILVVDDVKVNLQVIINLLKKTKIRVDTAQSGVECLALTEKNSYDIIFMDHMMPEMNGVETYAKMKESKASLNRNTPIIMLTAIATTGIMDQYLEFGFSNYLAKPVSGDKLEKMILKYLPKDKIQQDFSTTSTKSQKKQDAKTLLQNLVKIYPKADLSLGLSYCGESYDIYFEIVKTFGENTLFDELNSYFEQKDIKNYQVTAHGVKSSSLNIGFSELSKQARSLEFAAKDSDWDFIEQHHSSFLDEYQDAINAILQVIADSQ